MRRLGHEKPEPINHRSETKTTLHERDFTITTTLDRIVLQYPRLDLDNRDQKNDIVHHRSIITRITRNEGGVKGKSEEGHARKPQLACEEPVLVCQISTAP